jgi:hypothetical protein
VHFLGHQAAGNPSTGRQIHDLPTIAGLSGVPGVQQVDVLADNHEIATAYEGAMEWTSSR